MVESSLPEIGSRWGPHVGVDSMEEMENERDSERERWKERERLAKKESR